MITSLPIWGLRQAEPEPLEASKRGLVLPARFMVISLFIRRLWRRLIFSLRLLSFFYYLVLRNLGCMKFYYRTLAVWSSIQMNGGATLAAKNVT